MTNSETQVCSDYERMIITRGSDPLSALIPRDHNVNWEDQPSRFKVYFDVPRLPLPAHHSAELGTLAGTIARAQKKDPLGQADVSIEQLSTLLRFSNGVLQRKLDINWNLDHTGRATHHHAVFARPSASGGGMYPFEIYLVTGQGQSLMPGAYHYDNAHHALEQLVVGDVSQRIRAAVYDHPAAGNAAYFVLITLNFWKNYFKYHNFCYHVVTQDLGAELGTLRTISLALNIEPTFLLWFKDEMLNRVLGIETAIESVFAVVAVGRGGETNLVGQHAAKAAAVSERAAWYDTALTRKSSFQRSKSIFALPLIESVHRSALLKEEPRPSASAVAAAHCAELSNGACLPLPPPTPELLDKDLFEVFMKRSSSWGRMTSHPRMENRQVATMLRYATSAQGYHSDIKIDSTQPRFTRVMLFANHLNDVPAGIYSHDADNDCLRTVREGDASIELQRRYFLENYNLEQAACVVAIVGRVEGMLKVYGNRGLRILNAEVGLVAQSLYMATAAMSVGCGAILGFDNIALNRLLGLEGSDQTSLLLLLIGPQREEQGRFDYRIV